MEKRNLDTRQAIFALATGAPPTAVAIVRLSGKDSFSIAAELFRSKGKDFGRERGLWFGALESKLLSQKIDDIVLLSFVGPHSFTGEDVIEFQCHGSLAVVTQLQEDLVRMGARPAERGEFTYRGLMNNRISPEEIDRLGDLFLSTQPADLGRLFGQFDEAVSSAVLRLRDGLITAQAMLDTAVDFSEEYSSVIHQVVSVITQVTHECSSLIRRYNAFAAGDSVPRLVLVGRPNAGKSSLFNALLCRHRALVSEEPGTTRDVIEEDLILAGRRWKLVDTAGLREVAPGLEAQGIELGENYLRSASFWIHMVDGNVGITEEERERLFPHRETPHLVVWNKKDAPGWQAPQDSVSCLGISAKTGEGLEALWARLEEHVRGLSFEEGPLPSATHVARLKHVERELAELAKMLGEGVPPEFIAEKNRQVLDLLVGVMAEVTTEEVLDRVFRDFCIGK